MKTIPTPDKETLLKFQKDLPRMRRVAGWSQTDLATMLGMTKQNISGIEREKQNLTVLHYYAIRYVFNI